MSDNMWVDGRLTEQVIGGWTQDRRGYLLVSKPRKEVPS